MYQELSLLSDYKQELHSWNGAPPRIGDVLVLILIVHNYCIFTGPMVVLIFTYQELYCSPGLVHRQELVLCWWVGAA